MAEPAPKFLEGCGEMGELIRKHDWSSSGLGPPETWPSRLQGYVDMILRMPTAAIIFWGPEQTQIYNAGYAVIMGPRHPKYLGSSYKECWPDTYPTIYPWMRRVLDEGEVVEVDRTLIPVTRYGFNEEAYFTFSFVPLRDDDDRINGFIQPVAEVTEAMLAERRLATLRAMAAKATTRSELVSEASAAFQQNTQDLPFAVFYLWNEQARRLEVAARPNLEGPTGGLDRIAEQVFVMGEPSRIEDLEAVLGRPHQGPWPEPTRQALALPLRGSPAQPAQGVLLLGISPRLRFDAKYQAFFESLARELAVVLEQLRTQEALRESESRLRRVVEASGAGTWELDPATLKMTVDPRLLALWGLPPETDCNLNLIVEGIHPDDRAHVQAAIAAAFEGKNGGRYHAEFRTIGHGADGDRWVEGRGQVFFDQAGKPARFFGTGLDITARKLAEDEVRKLNQTLEQRVQERTAELKEANRELEAFSYSVSHDLRAPLRHIMGFAQLLEKRSAAALDDKSRDYLRTIAEAARQGGRLVDDLLAFSRMGRAEMKHASVALGPLVKEVQLELAPEATGRRITWNVRALPEVQADPALLRLVLKNLLSNALKYTRPRPEAVIEVSGTERPTEVEVRVQDNGVGFDMSYLDKLFGVFQRLHTAEEFEGTGIGLANVRRIVQRHGGRVWAEGRVGEGAAFYFTLPRAHPTAPGALSGVS